MLYRENGQFKTTYRSDQQVFPILQDRVFIVLLLAFALVGAVAGLELAVFAVEHGWVLLKRDR